MNDTKPAAQETTGNHVEVFFYRVPKKNRDAIERNLNKFRPWFHKQGVGLEYHRLGGTNVMEGCEGIAKTLAVAEDEDVWMETQYYRDRKHAEDTFASMMKDKELEPLGHEFFGLITQGKSMVTGGFDRFKG
ncbi:MAG: DUF1428 family protein [Nitrososphaera sp.]|jgi:uncharacterized protein YbaA (DUF1428 family)